MKTLAKYHVCNHCVIGEKTFVNILIGPCKLPGLSRNGPQVWPSGWGAGLVIRRPGFKSRSDHLDLFHGSQIFKSKATLCK